MNTPTWRKSSRSGTPSGGGECVELAALHEGIGVRDSKLPEGGHLTLDPARFAELVRGIKTGKYTR